MHEFFQKPYKRKWYLYVYGILCASLMLFVCYLMFSQHVNTRFDSEASTRLNTGWLYTDASGEQQTVVTPVKLLPDDENRCRISNVLPDSADGQYFARYCAFQSYRLYIDDVLYFDSSMDDVSKPQFKSSEGYYWSIVPLPGHCSGKTITIEQTSAYDEYAGQFGNLFIGNKASILFAIIRMKLISLVTCCICLLCGLVMSVVGFFVKEQREKMRPILFLGWFQIWVAIWLFSESGCTQFLFSNAFIANLLSFVGSKMMLLTFVLYIESILEKKRTRLFTLLYAAVLADLAVTMLLQATGVSSFFETMTFCHILVALSCVLVIYCVCYDTFVNKNQITRMLLLCILLLAVCAIAEVLNMYFGNLLHFGSYMIIGVAIFILVMGITSLLDMRKYLMLCRKTQYYENLAMKDVLTQCFNRTAYWMDMEHWRKYSDNIRNMTALMCDINSLKIINDTHGHKAGDEAIILFAQVLQDVFDKYGKIYRIGGDEFVVLIENLDRSLVDALIAEFNKELALRAQGREYRVAGAIGVSVFDDQRDSVLEDTIKRADELMYKNKRAQKTSAKL